MKRFSFPRMGWILLLCLTLSVSASAVFEGSYIFDEADVLSDEQAQIFENQAASMAETYGFPVYFVTVENFEEYGFDEVYDCAVSFYEESQLGFGDAHDGELLFMSMSDRKYALVYTGYGDTAFTESGRDRLESDMLSYFRDNDWAGGVKAYMDWSEYLLSEAAGGTPYGWEESGAYHPNDDARDYYDEDEPGLYELGITIGAPLLIALVICGLIAAQLKTVQTAKEAKAYAVPYSLNVTRKNDRFTHVTETRVKVEDDSKSGGSHHHSGGGHSGRSGGF